ncbi:hypothetical protein C8R43DRAFT_271612 [Mycena crocata]|nr:hypothetical protein C8R43DRAFT_271612 [Mycena crocata]
METESITPGFDSLPSEVLEEIFTYLSPREIQSVFSVCRRLHRISIDVLLQAHGILDASANCEVVLDGDSAEYGNALPILQSALYITSMDRFTVIFTGKGDSERMTLGMQRCQRILDKFQSIREVAIDFQNSTYDATFLANWRMGEALKTAFDGLLNAVTNLPALSSLGIATGWHFDTNYVLEIFPVVESWAPPATSSLGKFYKNFLPRKDPAPRSHTLTEFFIDTPILVLPSFYSWTMALLSSRSITSLRLQMLIAPIDWGIILPEIADAVPQLAELTLLGVRMDAAALIHAVSQFRYLTLLTMDSAPDFASEPSFRMISPPPASPPSRRRSLSAFRTARVCLERLTTLATRPEHLDVLLQPQNPLPALVSLCIRVELRDLNARPTTLVMARILARLRRSRHKSMPLTLDVRANISPEALMCQMLDVALAQGETWGKAFGTIQHLRVRDYGDRSGVVLARWLALFRGAKTLELKGNAQPSPSVSLAVREIRRLCPNIGTIVIGETTYETTANDVFSVKGSGVQQIPAFLDLPDDVLLIVFGYLGDELYSLSHMSRRLNLLALPTYLAHKGIPNPSELCDFRLVNQPTGGDVLSALNSALFLREIKHVSCQFRPGGIISCYLDHIERLTAFLHKFSSVESVSLSLVDLGNVDGELVDLLRDNWRRVFGALLNVILEKSCTSLTIRGAPYLKPSPDEPLWPSADAAVRLSSAAQANSSIRSFSFHPNMALSYFGILWTFSALRCSQLSVLSVRVISGTLLTVIGQELPNLPELEVVSCSDLLDHQLLALLCKLTRLTRLSLPIKANIQGKAPFAERVVPAFPCLQHLIAPVPFITHFLMADKPFPALEALEIRTATDVPYPADWPLGRLLASLRERGPTPTPTIALEIALMYKYGGNFSPWWVTALFGKELEGRAEAVEVLKLWGSSRNGPLGPACEKPLRQIVHHFPALRVLSVDEKYKQKILGLESALGFVRGRCPSLEGVYLNGVPVYESRK